MRFTSVTCSIALMVASPPHVASEPTPFAAPQTCEHIAAPSPSNKKASAPEPKTEPAHANRPPTPRIVLQAPARRKSLAYRAAHSTLRNNERPARQQTRRPKFPTAATA